MMRSRETTDVVSRSSRQLAMPGLQEDNVRPVMQAATVSVCHQERGKRIYEDVLGFEPDEYHDQTRWQSYHAEGRAYFAIIENPDCGPEVTSDVIDFDPDGIEDLWDSIAEKTDIELPLQETTWVP